MNLWSYFHVFVRLNWKTYFFLLVGFIFWNKFQFVDDDGKCYLEMDYTFDIKKEWPHWNFNFVEQYK